MPNEKIFIYLLIILIMINSVLAFNTTSTNYKLKVTQSSASLNTTGAGASPYTLIVDSVYSIQDNRSNGYYLKTGFLEVMGGPQITTTTTSSGGGGGSYIPPAVISALTIISGVSPLPIGLLFIAALWFYTLREKKQPSKYKRFILLIIGAFLTTAAIINYYLPIKLSLLYALLSIAGLSIFLYLFNKSSPSKAVA